MLTFKQYILEMPMLNNIEKGTTGYTDKDLDDLEIPKNAEHVFNAESGHKILLYSRDDLHHFVAQNPDTKKIDMHFTGKMSDDEYEAKNMHGRTGSKIKAHHLLDEIRTKLNKTIVSDISQSKPAKRVWEKLRQLIPGKKMYYRPISGGEVFAGKTGSRGELDAYYGPGKGALVVKASGTK